MRRHLFSFILCLNLLSICMAGCTDMDENLATSTIEPSATPTEITIIIPEVTLSPQENEAALLELLRTNGNCTGKCIGGIRPDEMTVQEAVGIMEQWGNVSSGVSSLGKTFIGIDNNPLYGHVAVYLDIGTWTKKFETIDYVEFRIQDNSGKYGTAHMGEDLWLANREAWRGFRLDNLLKAYGLPSYVGYDFSTTGEQGSPGSPSVGRTINYAIEIQYKQTNMDIFIDALAYYNGSTLFICPSKDPHYLLIEINPERPLEKKQEVFTVTWQALTGTDLDAFYQMFTDKTNPDACVRTTLEQIQTLQPEFR